MQHRQPYTERKNNLLSKLGQGNTSCIEAKNRNATIVDGTCQWVKTHQSFTHWQGSGTTRLLLVTADPGCGKSVLARHLVDDVLGAHTFVCYFFFKDDYENQKTLVGALRSILHQILVAYDGLITDKMLQGNEDGSLDLDSVACLWKTITELPSSTTFPNIVCVIDALDECVEKDREELFRLLEAIQSDTMTPSRLKFLVTSRPYDNVARPFRILRANQGAIHIRGDDDAQSEQISREVGHFIGHHVARLKIKCNLNMEEADLVHRTLASYKNRTYLWVELTLKSIEQLNRITKKTLLRQIKNLPATIDAAYDGILARIEKNHEKIASRIFHFLIGACRPLTVDEMAFAIGLEESNYAHVQVDAVAGARAESFIRAVSGLFVHIKDRKVFLMHQTAREFLLCHTQTLGTGWKSSISIRNAHRELAAVCLIRLSMKDYFLDNKEVDQTMLLEYAANNVVHHCCEAKDELSGWALDLASMLCRNKRLPNMTWFPHCRNWVGNLAPDTDLIVATSLRSVPLVQIMLQNIEKDVLDAKESFYGKTALRIAVDAGSSEIIQLLLDAGADPDIPDDKNEAPIHIATTQAMEENLEALLEAGAETDVLDKDGLSPLMLSCYDTAYEEATRILLAYRSNTNFCNSKGRNALFYAAEKCEVQQAMLLLRHGCDVTHADKEGNTALHLAAASVLDPEGCDVDPTIDDDGPELLALLIHYGADVNARNHKGETALHIAVGWKYGPVHRMKALISRKARMDVVDAKRRTPRHRALERGAQDAVKLLDACRKNSRLPASWGNTWPRAAWETA
ncbi:ankyrin repeat-containing domain protein [Microdochium bolleyi]|uniref:Ankyrin repeat-containing domain protein n=1 Tax=Microdochium bolleyi TaxID=196109 RepID=A0A136IRF2_9PEZI|nr:ankyrin repeat-containing domain protein [Microdochium bolleyi]